MISYIHKAQEHKSNGVQKNSPWYPTEFQKEPGLCAYCG